MDNVLINKRFQSIVYILVHFSCSLIQLSCVFAILGLQITLTITQTCSYSIGAGFWSFPFLFASPLSIWILLWKRNSLYCYFTFLIHICSTLFATAIILISFLVLIGQIGSPCSTSSSTNDYVLPMNISLMAVSFVLKICIYGEIVLLYMLKEHTNESSILSDKEFHEKHYQSLSDDIKMNLWSSFRSVLKENHNKNNNDLDV